MNLFFLNGSWLPWIIAAAGVPVVIHLLARGRPPKITFSSLRFLLKADGARRRLRKPQDWLLLVLRTLLVMALILLFLRPILRDVQMQEAETPQARHVVLVVDATASMSAREGGRSRLATAAALAGQRLRDLPAGSTANVIWMRNRPDPIFPVLGPNLQSLQEALQSVDGSMETGLPDDAVAAAVSMLEKVTGVKEIVVFSDFQESTWKGVTLQTPGDIALRLVPVGESLIGNTAITRLTAEPASPLVNENVSVQAEVANFSAQPRKQTLYLDTPGGRQAMELNLEPWSTVPAVFRFRPEEAGALILTASLDEDELAGDNRRWAVLETSQSIPVAIVTANAEASPAREWAKALRALEWMDLSIYPNRESVPAATEVLFLADWDGNFGATQIPTIAALGPGTRMSPELRLELAREPWFVRVEKSDHPAFRVFADGRMGEPVEAAFKQRYAFSNGVGMPGSAVLAYQDGMPALWQSAEFPNLLIWNLDPDPATSSWASQPQFLTFLGELVATGRTREGRVSEGVPGQAATLALREGSLIGDYKFLEGEAPLPVEASPDGALLLAHSTGNPGVYTWNIENKSAARHVVNFSPEESDLRPLDREATMRVGGEILSSAQAIATTKDRELWPWILALVVLLLFCEMAAVHWIEKT